MNDEQGTVFCHQDQALHLGRKSVFRGGSKQQTSVGGYVRGTEVHLDFLVKNRFWQRK